MELYNVYFEMSSICFLVLLIVLMGVKRRLFIFKNRLFYFNLYVMLLLNVVDLASAMLINQTRMDPGYDAPVLVMYALTVASYLLQQLMVMLFLVYVISFLELNRLGNAIFWLLSAASVVYSLLVLSTPVTKLIFYYDAQGQYMHGPLYFLYFLIPVVVGVYGVLILLVKHRMLTTTQRWILPTFFCVTMLGLFVQVALLPNCLMIYFCVTIALTGVFLTLQSPDYYLDWITSAFNSDGLTVMINDRIERQKPFSILFMSVHDFEGIKDGFSTKNKKVVYSKICTELYRRQGRRKKNRQQEEKQNLQLVVGKGELDVFRDDDRIYIMFYNMKKAEQQAIAIGSWLTDGIKLDGVEQPVKLVAKMLLFDFPGNIRSEEEFYSVIKYFLTDDYYNRYNELHSINEEFFRKKKRYEDVRGLVEEAIRTEGVEMYYQPIYSAEKKNFHSAEALVRLRDTDSIGFVSPEEFIPIAEKEHLILQLEDIILRKICEFIQSARLHELGVEYIEVNLSGNQCMQANLYIQLQDLIREYNISPHFINFEVTETATIVDSTCLSRNMEEMKSYGSTFALDDYGSGASNLKYLVDYPFEIVKLDKSIVWTHFRESNPKTRPVLPQSVNMLREMNVRIVAEGVEYEEEKDGLIGMGVQYLQGYYFSKPICEKDFLRFLKQHNNV